MPNRILKESICTSETINSLSDAEENFFYRILVNCDDYGRMDARPLILLAKCYPLKIGSLTAEDIENRLQALVRAGLVSLYEVDGVRYLQVTTWDKHQRIRNKRSKHPAPYDRSESNYDSYDTCQQPAVNCCHLSATCCQVSELDSNCPPESESESENNNIFSVGHVDTVDNSTENEPKPSNHEAFYPVDNSLRTFPDVRTGLSGVSNCFLKVLEDAYVRSRDSPRNGNGKRGDTVDKAWLFVLAFRAYSDGEFTREEYEEIIRKIEGATTREELEPVMEALRDYVPF